MPTFILCVHRNTISTSVSILVIECLVWLFLYRKCHIVYTYLLARYTAGEWEVEIPLIVSNHPDMEIAAKRFGIDYRYFPITKENKAEQEAAELALLKEYNIEFIVLARYMQIVSPEFISEYPNRIINIHHSFLPAFIGAKPYHAAFERGVKLIGATSHYVTSESRCRSHYRAGHYPHIAQRPGGQPHTQRP